MSNKLMSVFCAFLIAISFSIPVLAEEKNGNDSITTVTFNEYDYYIHLSKQSDKSLESNGFSKLEIQEIRNFEDKFHEHVEYMNQSYSDEQLVGLGYTKEQIQLIRNFDGSTESSKAIAATMTLNIWLTNKSTSGSNRTATVNYNYSWSGETTVRLNDTFGAIVGNGYTVSQYHSTSIQYYDQNRMTWNTVSYSPQNAPSSLGNNGYVKFPVFIYNTGVAMKGNGSMNIYKNTIDIFSVPYGVSYGHQVYAGGYSISVGLNIGGVGSVGVSYTPSSSVNNYQETGVFT
ncbi:hypothetical protein [Methanolapillus ohkumae]|uniref:Uncharacterized protein n=1 Tax=Methanolapillus ohkumae TaxID=3028298 RepID=A0AA96V7H6_9EURY|nr:hypothetical protein MsAm2_10570 [Methanosarcinaceae archaeon Am2]